MAAAAAEILAALGGRYTLVAEYAGGEGCTLCVRERDVAATWVLKVLDIGADPAEASLLLSLRHPAIPAVHEVGRLPDGRAFVRREHVDGDVLRTLPREPGPLRAEVQQLLEVLAYVHLRGIVHADLKPANLLRDRSGRLHLLDFGLGLRGGARGRGGTPFFAAPELLLGASADARTDLFAVGAMVAQALWPGSGPPLARFVATFPREDFFAAGGIAARDLPPPFDAFVPRCVARAPEQRFRDAQEALEFLCGGSGRPALALLAPDPVAMFAPELAEMAAGSGDLVLHGGSATERRALAMHLAAGSANVRAVVADGVALRIERDGGPERTVRLPPLDGARLLPFVQQVLGLHGVVGRAAADWLAEATGGDGDTIAARLRALVDAGEIVPSGARWTWPAARSGRLGQPVVVTLLAPSPQRVGELATSGRRDAAIAMWRELAATRPDVEPAARRSLAAGLLDAGEPAVALPFCIDLPDLRAQALLDTGQLAAATRELDAAGSPTADPRRRRIAAQLAMARGEPAQALAWLRPGTGTELEQVTLAAVYEQCGRLDEADAVLAKVVPALAGLPFAAASAHTVRGHVARRRGDLLAARGEFALAAELLFRIGHVRHAATAQRNLGIVAKDLGEHAEAIERLREARTLHQHVGDAVGAARTTASLGIAALARGDAQAALPWLREAGDELARLGDVGATRLTRAMLARAAAEVGERAEAMLLLQELGDGDDERMRAELAQAKMLLQRDPDVGPPPDEPTMPTNPPTGPSRELFRTFLAVNRQLAQETDLDKAMRHLLDAAVTLSGGRIGYLLVARDDGMRREFQSGDAGPTGQAFSRSLAHRAMQLQRTLTGADGLADRDLQDMPSIKNLQVRSAVCAPFRSAGGTVGAIYVEHPGRAGAFRDDDKEALEVLADQAAIAVDRMLREESLASELSQSRRELAVVKRSTRRESAQLLGDSKPMRDLRAQIDKLAPLELPVLVLGETGTGKELVARALHDRSARHRGPFVAENCSALAPELMERELFGHVQGAFTGADRDRPGLLELASGGTLFLDEVGDMPPALQSKLLRALQEQSIRRVGGSESMRLDLRLVAATHKDLRAMVQQGAFREDLFFRLAAVELVVPPLRDRDQDVVQLAEHFVRLRGAERGRSLRLSAVAKAALRGWRWPGNVRELEHVVARAALTTDHDEIVDLGLPASAPVTMLPGAEPAPPTVVTLKEAERRTIVAALQACGGDKAKTARALGISRTALYEKLKRFELG